MKFWVVMMWALAGYALATDFSRAPWDKYGCTFHPDGRAVSYPCIDNRRAPDVSEWARLDKTRVIGHSRATEVFDLCAGEHACKIGGEYHVTSGDVGALE